MQWIIPKEAKETSNINQWNYPLYAKLLNLI